MIKNKYSYLFCYAVNIKIMNESVLNINERHLKNAAKGTLSTPNISIHRQSLQFDFNKENLSKLGP